MFMYYHHRLLRHKVSSTIKTYNIKHTFKMSVVYGPLPQINIYNTQTRRGASM